MDSELLIVGDWSPARLAKVSRLVVSLYAIVAELNEEFEAENKRFTPDGVMVGHLGEVIAAYVFDLVLLPSSSKTHDAITRLGDKKIQIKMTGGKSCVAFRGKPDYLVALQLLNGKLSVVYNGEGHKVWEEFAGKSMPSNGQHRVSLARLRELNAEATEYLPQVRPLPIFE